MDFIPDFGGWPLTILAFVVALSIIVAVHEYGHYIVGRWSGIKAEVFSLGFGPVLFSRTDRRGTKWQIAALPFGGYVKFLGDASAASDRPDEGTMAALSDSERRHTMHGAPLWARAATVAAGPVFNFILSIAIFAAVSLSTGRAVEEAQVGTIRDLPADMALLEEGDVVTALEGREDDGLGGLIEAAAEATEAGQTGPTMRYTVERDGETLEVEATPPMIPVIDAVNPQTAAMEAGLQAGDLIRAVDGRAVHSFHEVPDLVEASEGAPLALTIWRAGEEMEVTLEPRQMDLPAAGGGFETRWLIGFQGGLFFEPVTEPVGPGEAVGYGARQVLFVIESSLSGLWHMITGAISTCNLQGPIGIAETSGAAASQGIDSFIWFVAVLSTAVGLLNLFPIPVLDGGHLVFHAYEAAAGRPPSDRALRVLMSVGLTLLLSLMLFATFNDFVC